MTKPLKLKSFLLLLFIGVVLGSCTEDVATEMILNGKSYASSASQPSPNDPSAYYEVSLARPAKIIAVDRSDPAKSVTKRKWVLKGPNGIKLAEEKDTPSLAFECDQPGWYAVYLEVNNQAENAKTCWIYAKSPENALASEKEKKEKSFEIIFPIEADYTTNESNIELAMRTRLWEKSDLDGITVRLNNQPFTNLVLDLDKELTTARLYLKEGKNTIDIKADINGEIYEEQLVVQRDKKRVSLPVENNRDNKIADNKTSTPKKVEPKIDAEKTKSEVKKPIVENKKVEETKKIEESKKVDDKIKPEELKGIKDKVVYADFSALESCTSRGLSKAIFKISAKRLLELESFIIHTSACGKADITVKKDGKTIATRVGASINKGKNELYLGSFLLGQRLQDGDQWTIEVVLNSDKENNCPEVPKFNNVASCAPISPNETHLSLSGSQLSVIGQINYIY